MDGYLFRFTSIYFMVQDMGYHNACFILKHVFSFLQLCRVIYRHQLGQVGWWFKLVLFLLTNLFYVLLITERRVFKIFN